MSKAKTIIEFDVTHNQWFWKKQQGNTTIRVGPILAVGVIRALNAIDDGVQPREDDLFDLKTIFPDAIFYDSNGQEVGELFP